MSLIYHKITFLGIFFIAYIIQSVTGFAGNVLSVPFGAMLFDLTTSVTTMNLLGGVTCIFQAALNLKNINWKEFGKLCAGAGIFMLIGMWLSNIIAPTILLRIYGALIIVIGLYYLLVKNRRRYPKIILAIIVACSGLIQGLFVSGGALLVVYALQKIPEKNSFRSTLTLLWAVLNAVYAVIAALMGRFTPMILKMALIGIPLGIIASLIGQKIAKKISQETFLKFVYLLLICVGIVTLVTS